MKLKPKLKELKIADWGAEMLLQNVRLAFVNLAKANTKYATNRDAEGNPLDGVFSVTCLVPKEDFEPIKIQLQKTVTQLVELSKKLKTKGERNSALKTALAFNKKGAIFKDGDKQLNKDGNIYDGLKNHNTVLVKSKAIKTETGFKPKVAFKILDKYKEAILRDKIADTMYSGIYADVAFNLTGYVFAKEPGIALYLSGVMKLADGETLGGSDPFEVRDDVEDEINFTAKKH